MKKVILAAVASTAIFATPAFGQNYAADGIAQYALNANVQSFCRLGVGQAGATTNATIDDQHSLGFGGSDGRITLDIQNPADNTIREASATYNMPNTTCNSGFTIRVQSSNAGLKTAATTSDTAFTSNVPYQYEVSFDGLANGGERSSNFLANPVFVIASNEARSGPAAFRVRVPAQDAVQLLQGTYTDIVTVTLAPSA